MEVSDPRTQDSSPYQGGTPGSSSAPGAAPVHPTAHADHAFPHLLSYEDLAEWLQDNEFILHGYRPVSGSTTSCFGSWLYLHNESVNIYSHLVPAAVFFVGEGLLLVYLYSKCSSVSIGDVLVFSFFMLAAVLCLSISALYHTLTNHSPTVDGIWLRLDFLGIILLTIGTFVSGIHVVFWCEPMQRCIYWSMITALGVIDICVLVSSRFQGRPWRAFRVMCFVGTGLSGVIPIAHGISMFGLSQMVNHFGLPYFLAEGAFLAMGALVYTTRFPEVLCPGKFDIYGASHQLFHVLVVIAIVVHLAGLLSAHEYNYTHRSCIGL